MYDPRPERGTKRTCQSCEARFYDLARTPILCPKCGAEFVEIVRPVPAPYQRGRRALFAKDRPEEPVVEEARSEDEEQEAGEESDGEEEESPAEAADEE